MRDECYICQHQNVWKCCPKLGAIKLPADHSEIKITCKHHKKKED